MKKNYPWIPYVGDCKAVDNYLDSKSGNCWLLLKFVNAFLRGISQVVFANNPLSGFLILAALFYTDVTVGLATTIATSAAILTACVMKQELGSIKAGLTTYNSVLVGCVTASLWTPLYNEQLSEKLWAFIIICSILSVFVGSGLATIVSKWDLPVLTLPFNVVTLLLFVSLMPPQATVPASDTSVLADLTTSTLAPDSLSSDEINWAKVLAGIVCSMGQVFAVETLIGSIIMYIAVLAYSPLLCLMSLLGAIIGTLSGILFTSAGSYEAIYTGIWGYNGILSAASVGGFFFVFTAHSLITAVANVMFTVLIQQGLVGAFHGLRLPVFTLPFVLSTFIFLSVTSSGDYLTRVTNVSFPEMHRIEYLENLRNKENDIEEQAKGESKDLVQSETKEKKDTFPNELVEVLESK